MQQLPSAFWPKPWQEQTLSTPPLINTDKHAAYPPAIVQLKAEGALDVICS